MEKQIEIVKSIKAGDLVEDKHAAFSKTYKFFEIEEVQMKFEVAKLAMFTGFVRAINYETSCCFSDRIRIEDLPKEFYSGSWICYFEVFASNLEFLHIRIRGEKDKVHLYA